MEPAGISAVPSPENAGRADAQGLIAGRPLDEWNMAYVRVESYFQALGMRNKLLLGQSVTRVLDRAIDRAPREAQRPPMELAAEEMEWLVADWYSAVLDVPSTQTDPLLSTRGRLSLLLADMPGRWQDQFLKPPPWPEEFVRAMREGHLRAGPDFQLSQMAPRPIDLGPIATLTSLGNIAWLRMAFAWLAFVVVLGVIFNMTR